MLQKLNIYDAYHKKPGFTINQSLRRSLMLDANNPGGVNCLSVIKIRMVVNIEWFNTHIPLSPPSKGEVLKICSFK